MLFSFYRINGMTIATDIICGFPTESESDFDDTLTLCQKYKFPSLFINQYFPRPGTPAALLPRIPSADVKQRTKKLTELFYAYEPYNHKIGEVQEVLVTEISHDKKHYVGHNKFYEQVLVPLNEEYMGKIVAVKIIQASKFSMIGEPLNKVVMPGLVKPLQYGTISGVKQQTDGYKVKYALIFLMLSVLLRLFWIFYYGVF